MSRNDKKRDKAQGLVLQIYAAFGSALILSLLPHMSAAFMSLALSVAVLITAYIVRAKNDKGGFSENHMSFIIRTIWIGSFLASLIMIAVSAYLYNSINNAPLDSCVERFMVMGAAIDNMEVLKALFRPCQAEYIQANLKVFLVSGAMVAVPTLGYFSFRFFRGLLRALKGYRVSDVRSWL